MSESMRMCVHMSFCNMFTGFNGLTYDYNEKKRCVTRRECVEDYGGYVKEDERKCLHATQCEPS